MGLERRSRGLLDVSAAILVADGLGGLAVGSAVSVWVGDRILLATAAHTLAGVALCSSNAGLRVVPRGRYRADPVRVLGVGVASGRVAADVAWIEVERRSAERAGLRALPVAELGCAGDGEQAAEMVALGFPATGVAARQVSGTRFALDADALTGRMVVPGRHAIGFRAEHDLALAMRPIDAPYGFSGGGVWTTAGRGRVVALARSWNGRRGLLFCTRIEHWLALVRADFPGLLR